MVVTALSIASQTGIFSRQIFAEIMAQGVAASGVARARRAWKKSVIKKWRERVLRCRVFAYLVSRPGWLESRVISGASSRDGVVGGRGARPVDWRDRYVRRRVGADISQSHRRRRRRRRRRGAISPSIRPPVRPSCDGLLNGGTSGSVVCVHATVLYPAAASRVLRTITHHGSAAMCVLLPPLSRRVAC